MANTALRTLVSLAVIKCAFSYLGHSHALYLQQEPCSLLLTMYSTLDVFYCYSIVTAND